MTIVNITSWCPPETINRIASWAGTRKIWIDLVDGKLICAPDNGAPLTLPLPSRMTLRRVAMSVAQTLKMRHVDFWRNDEQGEWRAELLP